MARFIRVSRSPVSMAIENMIKVVIRALAIVFIIRLLWLFKQQTSMLLITKINQLTLIFMVEISEEKKWLISAI